jgi:hypothetical protein
MLAPIRLAPKRNPITHCCSGVSDSYLRGSKWRQGRQAPKPWPLSSNSPELILG